MPSPSQTPSQPSSQPSAHTKQQSLQPQQLPPRSQELASAQSASLPNLSLDSASDIGSSYGAGSKLPPHLARFVTPPVDMRPSKVRYLLLMLLVVVLGQGGMYALTRFGSVMLLFLLSDMMPMPLGLFVIMGVTLLVNVLVTYLHFRVLNYYRQYAHPIFCCMAYVLYPLFLLYAFLYVPVMPLPPKPLPPERMPIWRMTLATNAVLGLVILFVVVV